MKGKKFFFVLALAAIFTAGWLFTLKAASGVEEIKEQERLVEKAEEFVGKKIYVRGIPLLEQALAIDTDKTAEIQRLLLTAYFEYGDMDSYETLLSLMEQDQNTQAIDYYNLAKYQQTVGDLEGMIETLQKGLKYHDDAELKRMYEEQRYEYFISLTGYEDMLPTANAWMMPAYDGEAWCYTDDRGTCLLEDDYEEVFPFNQDGYGVVKKNQIYCTILQNGDLYGIDENGVDEVCGITDRYIIAAKDGQYGYYSFDFELLSDAFLFENITLNNCGVAAVKKNGKWGIITDDGECVTDYIYEDVAVNSTGSVFAANRAMVKKDGKWILIDCEGNMLTDVLFEDAKAPESDGYIAVANSEGKWGYIDGTGQLVIDYKYWDAKSFSCDVGAVCTANKWGYISADDVIVIEDSFANAEPFHNGIAIVYTAEGNAVIQMKYYEMIYEK